MTTRQIFENSFLKWSSNVISLKNELIHANYITCEIDRSTSHQRKRQIMNAEEFVRMKIYFVGICKTIPVTSVSMTSPSAREIRKVRIEMLISWESRKWVISCWVYFRNAFACQQSHSSRFSECNCTPQRILDSSLLPSTNTIALFNYAPLKLSGPISITNRNSNTFGLFKCVPIFITPLKLVWSESP